MKRFTIELYKEFEKASFYTIHFAGQELCETDRFIQRFMEDQAFSNDLQTIKYWIEKMGSERGALERYFRPERNASAIPIDVSDLRLYCVRVSDEVVILGNGGIKTSQAVQNSPDAYTGFKDANQVYKVIARSIKTGATQRNGKVLTGNLEFDIDD